jgi:AcrR family transcriptional regulator
MDAAVASIVEHGLSSTTLATVARASGLSQGTAVFYFKTKEILLSETFRHRMEEYRITWLKAISDAGTDPTNRIIAMTFASLDPKLLTRDDLAFWNAFWPEAARSNNLNTVFKQIESERQTVMRDLFEDAAGALQGGIWCPKSAAQAVETMIEGVWARLYYSADHMTLEEARFIAGLLLCSMFPSQSTAIMEHAQLQKAQTTAGLK